MLKFLRKAFFPRLLRQTLAARKRQRKIHTLQSAHSIGILFDATAEQERKEVLDFAHSLEEKQRKKVRLLGFVDVKQPLGQTLFPQFTQKDLRWNGKPDNEAVQAFIGEKFDLLLCLNKLQVPSIHWVASASLAAMKIGTLAEEPHDFDMILETPAEKGIPYFVDQLDLYLDKIIPSKYESASTL